MAAPGASSGIAPGIGYPGNTAPGMNIAQRESIPAGSFGGVPDVPSFVAHAGGMPVNGAVAFASDGSASAFGAPMTSGPPIVTVDPGSFRGVSMLPASGSYYEQRPGINPQVTGQAAVGADRVDPTPYENHQFNTGRQVSFAATELAFYQNLYNMLDSAEVTGEIQVDILRWSQHCSSSAGVGGV